MIFKDRDYLPLKGNNFLIRDCLLHLEAFNTKTGFILDANERLVGSFSDGDIRRGLLLGLSISDKHEDILNLSPIFICFGSMNEVQINQIFSEHGIDKIPVCDESGRYLYLYRIDVPSFVHYKAHNVVLHRSTKRRVAVLIQAGGFGKRMGDLTLNKPKPMLEVQGKPLLQHIIERLADCGLRNIYISLHYLPDVIKDYFSDGHDFGVDIKYIYESTPLGTAGALSLVDISEIDDFIVLNGDLRTNVNFQLLYESHVSNSSDLTVTVTEHLEQCPFGVVKINSDGNITGIVEKPTTAYFVNAGIYVVGNSILSRLTFNKKIDMPELIRGCILSGNKVFGYNLLESWFDVGNPNQLMKLRDNEH